ncbi:acyl--CoA ligase [bacterium]|nr:MAG: acyl--CoA ligase [bacterium]
MRLSTLDTLDCPICRSNYDAKIIEERNKNIYYGFLVCAKCNTSVPICAGFALFSETGLYQGKSCTQDVLQKLENSLFDDPYRYEVFVRQKSRRPSHDAYATFQPFNESSQAFLPLVPLLRRILKPGDRILDTWCRTGWSAGFLSGLFPDQQIISIWEGNSDTLGYRGFRYWYSQLPEDNNIEIVFHSMNQPLPLKNNSFSAVHALDTLHRYKQDIVIPELLRVAKQDGAILFPHVHLSNAQPVPYFDRGGTILHGTDYKERFGKLLAGSGRKVFVLSEPETFLITKPKPLQDNSETSDYNGLVVVVPEKFEGYHLYRETIDPDEAGAAYLIVNPIYTINLSIGAVQLDGNKLSGSVGKLFFRHPIYEKKLRSAAINTLTVEECEVIYWAKKAMAVAAIASKMKKSVSELMEIIKPLLKSELVQLHKLPEMIARLQYFHSDQLYITPYRHQTIKHVFENVVLRHADNPILISDEDGSTFLYRDAAEVVDAIAKKLLQSGLKKGDRIIVYSAMHSEAIFLFWAAMRMGIVFVPVDHQTPRPAFEEIAKRVDAKLIFCDHERTHAITEITHVSSILFDTDNSEAEQKRLVFSNWVNDRSDDSFSLPEVVPEDEAVILFTSGTTGNSKGVLLTQGALYRSGLQMSEVYEWETRDVLLSMGELHAMSGLRNPCIAPLFTGASIVVTSSRVRSNVIALAQCIQERKCTILNTVPSAVRQFDQFTERIGREMLSSLRCLLCTGSDLSEALIQSFEEQYGVPILDYYGLTETCGFCIGVPLQGRENAKGTLGLPVGCIAQVVDENDRILEFDRIGELRIYSENLMDRYYKEEALTNAVLRNGWFYTGDLAKIKPDNHIVLTGRKKDIIKDKFGNVVFPVEVEQCISGHPGVADVVVVGFRPMNEDEKLAAFIVPRDESVQTDDLLSELRSHIRNTIGPHKIPQILKLRGGIPMNSNGKPDKKILIDELN